MRYWYLHWDRGFALSEKQAAALVASLPDGADMTAPRRPSCEFPGVAPRLGIELPMKWISRARGSICPTIGFG